MYYCFFCTIYTQYLYRFNNLQKNGNRYTSTLYPLEQLAHSLSFFITLGPILPTPPLHLLPKVAEKGQW